MQIKPCCIHPWSVIITSLVTCLVTYSELFLQNLCNYMNHKTKDTMVLQTSLNKQVSCFYNWLHNLGLSAQRFYLLLYSIAKIYFASILQYLSNAEKKPF